MQGPSSHRLAAIPLEAISEQYHERGIGGWSDAELLHEVAAIVSVPREEPGGSFVLHAPLELAARASLLPMLSGEARPLARKRIVAIAVQYEAFEPIRSYAQHPTAIDSEKDPITWLFQAIARGDLAETDRAACFVTEHMEPSPLVAALTPGILTSTAAAAHAPILLYLWKVLDEARGLGSGLLRPLARSLARNPAWHIQWTREWAPKGVTDAGALRHAIEEFPLPSECPSSSIHPLMMAVDGPNGAARHLGSVLGSRTEDADRVLLRGAARWMLTSNPKAAPYGWTHALTMPQAVLGITAGTPLADHGLAIAATYCLAFRAGLANPEDSSASEPELAPIETLPLLDRAATSHDAHIVKYALATVLASRADPQAAPLYTAALKRLLDVWDQAGGDASDLLKA
ncbi:MAG: hypothetical protein H6830_05870 [Planctomycetes bacterium]|nr:hypothetical protein [Planctomycetota bacterium]MCB9909050.1 hypothetical protein [Planctomycetota bacterium]MCB9911704.1 hypothetical protein [Planctomycetota bacterium]HPF13280.1 hypothetical protein [Planctomycetota bacterium]HRV80632.1 hypothetical protein [Planctomycetota bacterium]